MQVDAAPTVASHLPRRLAPPRQPRTAAPHTHTHTHTNTHTHTPRVVGFVPGALRERTSLSVARSTQVICPRLGPYFKPKHVGTVEAVPILFFDNTEFDQPKFKKAMADLTNWVPRNLAKRVGAVCGMLTVISAGRPATGLTITVWGPEVRMAISPVLAARFAPLVGVPDAFVLNGTGIGAVVSPHHSSAGTTHPVPRHKTAPRRAARPRTVAQAPRPDARASESRTRACRAERWRQGS